MIIENNPQFDGTSFSLSRPVDVNQPVWVFVNGGVALDERDFDISGNTITLKEPMNFIIGVDSFTIFYN